MANQKPFNPQATMSTDLANIEHKIDQKMKSVEDIARFLKDFHAKSLKCDKARDKYARLLQPLAGSLEDMSKFYETYEADQGFVNIRECLLQSSVFLGELGKIIAKMNDDVARSFSGPINNFVTMEISHCQEARKRFSSVKKQFESHAKHHRGQQSKSEHRQREGKNAKRQQEYEESKQKYDQALAYTSDQIHQIEQKYRIYMVERLMEFVELHRTAASQIENLVSSLDPKFAKVRALSDATKAQFRQTHPQHCGSVLQGSSVTKVDADYARKQQTDMSGAEKNYSNTQFFQSPKLPGLLNEASEQERALHEQLNQVTRKFEETQLAATNVQYPACARCGQPIHEEGISALGTQFHASCFVCGSCGVNCVGNFCHKDQVPYCAACFAKIAPGALPTCAGCNQVIQGQYINAINLAWHAPCFACQQCKGSLQSGYFVKNGRPFCPNCK